MGIEKSNKSLDRKPPDYKVFFGQHIEYLRQYKQDLSRFFVILFLPLILSILVQYFFSQYSLWYFILLSFVVSIILSFVSLHSKIADIDAHIKNLDPPYEVCFNFIEKAIHDLVPKLDKRKSDEIGYLKQLLLYIDYSTAAILNFNSVETNSIHSNIYIPKGDMLELYAFDVDLPDRIRRQLPNNRTPPDPGASAAFHNREPQYVKNTKDDIYCGIFDSKEYNSFISFPIFEAENQTGKVVAIVNIDSKREDQFVNEDFIKYKLHPAIKPLFVIIQVLCNSGKIGTRNP